MKLDQAQRRILAQLQQDSSISTQNLAEKVGRSPSPCWRRVREMEEAGLIRGYVALLAATSSASAPACGRGSS